MIRTALALFALAMSAAAGAREPAGTHEALERLAADGRFSGAVVIRNSKGEIFARGYGMADPFTGARFTADTQADSGSLAKPVTAAAVLLLAKEGKLALDGPVQRYLPAYPHASTSVRHLLAHSGALSMPESAETLAGQTNATLIAALRIRERKPEFPPGSAFDYCNLCYSALALLIEQVSDMHYLDFAHRHLHLPRTVRLRPARLADWPGRAIGYRLHRGAIERFDSWEGEAFYGSANLSISGRELATWGSQWWKPSLAAIRAQATAPAIIAGHRSGLSFGNWYCSDDRRRCNYPGHHEGFHHNLYWDAKRRISVALMTNNTLAPALQQRLQRAVVAFAEERPSDARRELASPLPDVLVGPGEYVLPAGERIRVAGTGRVTEIEKRGLRYRAIRIGEGIRYVPGLDAYVAGAKGGGLHWLTLYEDLVARPA